jgi:hypothetical protein
MTFKSANVKIYVQVGSVSFISSSKISEPIENCASHKSAVNIIGQFDASIPYSKNWFYNPRYEDGG